MWVGNPSCGAFPVACKPQVPGQAHQNPLIVFLVVSRCRYPDKIIKIPVDIRTGITDDEALLMAEGLKVKTDLKAAAEQVSRQGV